MPLKLKTWLLGAVFFFSLCLFVLNSSSCAQDDLLEDSGGFPKIYMVEMSGKVLEEEFTGVRASIEISLSDPGSLNPYLVITRGFPKANSRNVFFWDSDATDMKEFSGEITSDIKRTFMRPLTYAKQPHAYIQCHFSYLSPVLIKHIKGTYIDEPREKERKATAIKHALPTLVVAQAGQLRIRVTGDMISGNVWMKGYDLIEHSYVDYNASFAGEAATRLKPKWQIKEPIRRTGEYGLPLKFK